MYTVYISADKSDVSTSVNARNRAMLRRFLDSQGYEYELAKGVYRGIEEQSFIVKCPKLVPITTLAKLFEQESILVEYKPNNWMLEFLSYDGQETSRVLLGEMREIKESERNLYDSYTQTKDGFFTVTE